MYYHRRIANVHTLYSTVLPFTLCWQICPKVSEQSYSPAAPRLCDKTVRNRKARLCDKTVRNRKAKTSLPLSELSAVECPHSCWQHTSVSTAADVSTSLIHHEKVVRETALWGLATPMNSSGPCLNDLVFCLYTFKLEHKHNLGLCGYTGISAGAECTPGRDCLCFSENTRTQLVFPNLMSDTFNMSKESTTWLFSMSIV